MQWLFLLRFGCTPHVKRFHCNSVDMPNSLELWFLALHSRDIQKNMHSAMRDRPSDKWLMKTDDTVQLVSEFKWTKWFACWTFITSDSETKPNSILVFSRKIISHAPVSWSLNRRKTRSICLICLKDLQPTKKDFFSIKLCPICLQLDHRGSPAAICPPGLTEKQGPNWFIPKHLKASEKISNKSKGCVIHNHLPCTERNIPNVNVGSLLWIGIW